MYGTTIQYSLAVDAPWKQFADRNVFNVNEAVKLIYDVSTQTVAREATIMVVEHVLRVLPDMPQTLVEFTRLILLMQKKPTTEKWQAVASVRRQQMLRILDSREMQAVNYYLRKELDLKADYADYWQAQGEEEGRRQR